MRDSDCDSTPLPTYDDKMIFCCVACYRLVISGYPQFFDPESPPGGRSSVRLVVDMQQRGVVRQCGSSIASRKAIKHDAGPVSGMGAAASKVDQAPCGPC